MNQQEINNLYHEKLSVIQEKIDDLIDIMNQQQIEFNKLKRLFHESQDVNFKQEITQKYLIIKSTRTDPNSIYADAEYKVSYDGSSCEKAGITGGLVYEDFWKATDDCIKLNEVNNVTFHVKFLHPENYH